MPWAYCSQCQGGWQRDVHDSGSKICPGCRNKNERAETSKLREKNYQLESELEVVRKENEELAQLWRGEQQQTIECSRLLHDAEAGLAAAAKIIGCAPDKVDESVQMFCDDSINSAKEMYEMRDAFAAAQAALSRMVWASNPGLMVPPESAIGHVDAAVERLAYVHQKWAEAEKALVSARRELDAIHDVVRDREPMVKTQTVEEVLGIVEKLEHRAAREEAEKLKERIEDRDKMCERLGEERGDANVRAEAVEKALAAARADGSRLLQDLANARALHIKAVEELAAARAENERMERDVRHWANEFSAKFGNYSRVDEYLNDLRASIALRARPDDGRVERAARVLFDARYPEHDHEHRDWHDMAGSERFHVQARTVLAAADGEVKP